MKINFVRGHMGGNVIILIKGDELPPGRELELAVKALGPNYLSGHELGLLYPGENGTHLRVKIAEPTSGCFISACGGLTQVLGKALVEAGLAELFGIDIEEPSFKVVLQTDAGLTDIYIEASGGQVGRVTTHLNAFMKECYDRGVAPMQIQGSKVVKAGKLLVVNAAEIKRTYPSVDFFCWNSEARRLLIELQQEFISLTGETEYNYCLYDWNPEHSGHVRVVYPHYIPQDFIEPSCGTGSVAVAIGLLASGELEQQMGQLTGPVNLRLEAGGGIELGGPDITELTLQVDSNRLTDVSFSHSLVEITSQGQVFL